jgi:phosphate:Na+ symporter
MIDSLLLFVTGITLFLFGMIRLSTEVRGLLSSRMRSYIKFIVKKPVYGLLTGMVTTVLFQSSSATTLLTIGIVSAGLISFSHSLGIILGADIGTTLTAQLVVWKVATASPVFILLGGVLYFTAKEKWKSLGEVTFYFGLIFYGFSLIGHATAPLKNSPTFIRFFQEAKNPLMGMGIGLIFTGIVHASAIPIGIMIILGQQGLISIENALPIMIGANVGTTVTALMGSVVANVNGKRSALAHLFFKCAGAAICLAGLPFFAVVVKAVSSGIGQQIAISHLIFNGLIALVFLFLLRPVALVMSRIMPGEDKTLPTWPEYLDEQCLSTPEQALWCVNKELSREIMLTQRMLSDSLAMIPRFSQVKKRDVMYIELIVDNLQTEITRYLWNISCVDLTPALSKKLFAFASIVADIERMGDHSTNLVELSESRAKRRAEFSMAAQVDLNEIEQLVVQSVDDTVSLFSKADPERIREIVDRTQQIDRKIKAATERHLERFYQKVCPAEAGPIFVDMLSNMGKISEHCRLIAGRMEGLDE